MPMYERLFNSCSNTYNKHMEKTRNSIIYLGIDIGKKDHAWATVDHYGQILEEGSVVNTPAKLTRFAKRMIKRHSELIVGCEATGSYYEKLAIAFLNQKVAIQVINPALTSTKALRSSMRMTKTDKQDARGIARKLQEKRGEIGTVFSWNPDERRLQALARHLQFLKKQRVALRVRTKDMLSRPFDTVDVNTDIFDQEIKTLEQMLIQETNRLYPEALQILVAIRGVGEKSACLLLAETQCLKRFPTSKSFAAFAGLDPTLKESGTSVHGNTRMTKAGSPHLRANLTWSSKLLVQWNDTFRECFENSLTRGKAPGVAYGIVARKFATVVHQCVTKNEMFDPEKVGLGTTP